MTSIDTSPGAPGTTLNDGHEHFRRFTFLGTFNFRHSNPGFLISSRANKLNFVRINSMDAVQSSLTVLIWNTQWVKEKRMQFVVAELR